jgi:hypothetical protein
MLKYLRTWLFLLIGLGAASAQAATISYSLNALGGNRYSYDYVFTAPPPIAVESFTIYFPFHLYTNLAPGNLPIGWLAMLAQPDPAMYVDGYFMAESTSGPMSAHQPTGGFSIEFDWTGAGLPGPQGYVVYDSPHFGFGNSEIGGTFQVSEPDTLSLSVLLLGVVGYRRSRPTTPLRKK